jgi:hypothetical protein
MCTDKNCREGTVHRKKKLGYHLYAFGVREGRIQAEQEAENILFIMTRNRQDTKWIERMARAWARAIAHEELAYTGVMLDTFVRGYVRGFLHVIRRAQRVIALSRV